MTVHYLNMTPPPYFCTCPGGPIQPDGLGECSRCHRITRERAAIVRCTHCGSPDVREVEDLLGGVTLRCIDCGEAA
jgi:hypothetical protein